MTALVPCIRGDDGICDGCIGDGGVCDGRIGDVRAEGTLCVCPEICSLRPRNSFTLAFERCQFGPDASLAGAASASLELRRGCCQDSRAARHASARPRSPRKPRLSPRSRWGCCAARRRPARPARRGAAARIAAPFLSAPPLRAEPRRSSQPQPRAPVQPAVRLYGREREQPPRLRTARVALFPRSPNPRDAPLSAAPRRLAPLLPVSLSLCKPW